MNLILKLFNCKFRINLFFNQENKQKIMSQQQEIKYKLNSICILETSKYFSEFSDYTNLELCCKRFRGNLERLKYNPIQLDENILQFFPNITTLHLYEKNDKLLELTKHLSHCLWYGLHYYQYKQLQEQFPVECKKLIYSIDDRKIDYKETDTSFIVPEGINKIDYKCFAGCSQLQSIIIPESVINIGLNCFAGCPNLTSITLGKQWIVRGNRIFNNQIYFQGIEIPSSVVEINGKHRPDINLIYMTIPSYVSQLRDFCFLSSRSLRKVFIPSHIQTIGKQCFSNCSALEEIEFPSIIECYYPEWISNCVSLTKIVLPGQLKNLRYSITLQSENQIKEVIFPTTLSNINDNVFCNCHELRSVELPNSLTHFKSKWFTNCSQLTKIVLPQSLTIFESDYCPAYKTIKSITLPSTLTSLGKYFFANCFYLSEINGLNNIQEFGDNCFLSCTALKDIQYQEIINKNTKQSVRLRKEEIEMIEKWTNKQFGLLLFDSDFDDWENSYSFTTKILNRKQLLFLIETKEKDSFNNSIIIGCYINTFINKKSDSFAGYINDPNAFLFSFKNDLYNIYPITNERKNLAFRLSNSEINKNDEYGDDKNKNILNNIQSDCLFTIGYYDLVINTKHNSSFCYQNNKWSSYQYSTSKELFGFTDYFNIDRITVVQMK